MCAFVSRTVVAYRKVFVVIHQGKDIMDLYCFTDIENQCSNHLVYDLMLYNSY